MFSTCSMYLYVCNVCYPGVMPVPGFPVRHRCEGSANHPQQAPAAALPEERHSRSKLGVLRQPLWNAISGGPVTPGLQQGVPFPYQYATAVSHVCHRYPLSTYLVDWVCYLSFGSHHSRADQCRQSQWRSVVEDPASAFREESAEECTLPPRQCERSPDRV